MLENGGLIALLIIGCLIFAGISCINEEEAVYIDGGIRSVTDLTFHVPVRLYESFLKEYENNIERVVPLNTGNGATTAFYVTLYVTLIEIEEL